MNASNAREYLPLVQALAEGKVIQYQYLHGKWGDVLDLYEHNPASDYRIKPEPREIWVNRYPDGDGDTMHPTKKNAIEYAHGVAVQVCYREVIE